MGFLLNASFEIRNQRQSVRELTHEKFFDPVGRIQCFES